MIKSVGTMAVAALFVFAHGSAKAAVCETLSSRGGTKEIRTLDLAYNYGPLTLMFGGEAVVVKGGSNVTRRDIRRLLRSIDRRMVDPGTNLLERPGPWIERFIGPPSQLDPTTVADYGLFQGTEGLLYYIWLKAAQEHMVTPGGGLRRYMTIIPKGRIKEGGGYILNSDNSGTIISEMCFEIEVRNRFNNVVSSGHMRYEVTIDVAAGGFKRMKRQEPSEDGYDEDDIFPGSLMKFSERMVPQQIKWKLEAARTDGNSPPLMSVREIYFEKETNGVSSGWIEFTNPMFKILGADACIDIFFDDQGIPSTLDPMWRPPYCMGRCTEPAIVNSGL